MTFRETFYTVKQLMVNRLIDFGLEDADIDLGWTTLLTLAQNTRVTIDVPLSLVYSDAFEISGTLETATYRRLAHKTLKLKVGNTIVDTTETDINGAYSFTTTPVSMGNHSFQVIFEGTNIYRASESSVVNRVIEKETSVINLDIIPTAHINGSTAVAGTLKSDDAELIKNATVKLDTPSGNTLSTTTNNYGQFSFTLTDIPDFNNVSVTCYFEGDTYYTPSTITVPVAVYQETLELTSDKDILSYADSDYATLTIQYKDTGGMNLGANKEIDLYRLYEVNDIELTSDKDILSYADSESATITAQLKYNNSDVKVSNEPISFAVYKTEDDSLVEDLGTENTDSLGQCSISYDAQGTGDVYVKAECGTVLSETYAIEDIYRYSSLTSDDRLFTETTGNPTVSYSSNGLSVTGTGFGDIYSYDEALPSDFSVECTVQAFELGLDFSGEFNVNGVGIALRDYNGNGYHINVYYNNGGSFVETAYVTPPFTLKFVANGSNVSVYLNNTLLSTQSKGDTGIWFKLFPDSGITIKNLKIKFL